MLRRLRVDVDVDADERESEFGTCLALARLRQNKDVLLFRPELGLDSEQMLFLFRDNGATLFFRFIAIDQTRSTPSAKIAQMMACHDRYMVLRFRSYESFS